MSISTSSRSSRIRRLAVSSVAAVGLLLGVSVTAAAPASAAVRSAYGGVGSTTASCGYSGLYRYITISPQTGYSYNQQVAYTTYVHDLTTGASTWTDWTYMRASSAIASWVYPENHTYQLYMRYAWLRGGTWTYAGEWLTSYGHRTAYGYQTTSTCDEW
jgi:hypothetical protein